MKKLFLVLLALSGSLLAQTSVIGPATSSTPSNAISYAASSAPVLAEYPMTEQSGTTLFDISGNGNNANFCTGTNAPSWNTDGVQFLMAVGGPAQCINTPLTTYGSILIAYTAWGYGQLTAPANTTGIATGGSPSNAYPTLWGSSTTAATGLYLIGAPTTGQASSMFVPTGYNDVSATFATSCANGQGGNNVAIYSPDTATDHIYQNGQECAYSAQTGNASATALSSGFYVLGASKAMNASFAFRGTIRYVKVFATKLTPAQAAQEYARMQNILAARTYIPKYPTFNKSRANQVLCIGDSLCAGYEGLALWFSNTYLTPANTYAFTTYGIGGSTAHDIDWVASQRWQQGIAPAATTNYCFVWAGTNDSINGYTAATAYTSILNIGRTAKASGCTPIAVTMISRTGEDTFKDALNPLIRNGAVSSGVFAAVVDLAESPVFADGGNTNTPCYNADKTHLTGPGAGTCANSLSGYSLVASAFTSAINMLDGSTAASPGTFTATTALTSANRFSVVNCGANCTITLPDCSFLTGNVTPFTVVNATASGVTATIASFSAAQYLYASGTTTMALTADKTYQFTPNLISQTTGGCYWTY